jgi:Holliday junction resolvasome RuvABC DNA-binding subunit
VKRATFGAEFMRRKRAASHRAAAEARAAQPHTAESGASGATNADRAEDRDVVPWLRRLGFRADEARRAAEHCQSIPHESLEKRVRMAVSFLGRT